MLTETDLDALHPEIHQACLRRAGVGELKGNALGLSGIERIAGKLRQLVLKYRMTFIFTRIEKRHLACTKFADTLMDSGLNKAVSNLHYGTRFFRLYGAHVLSAMLREDDREEFWSAYASGDTRTFCAILRRVEARIWTYVDDPRTRQILLDAISWALKNPEPLLAGTRSVLDAPNVVALGLLAQVLHEMHREIGIRVKAFIHDEQNEFGKILKAAYQYSSLFWSPTSPFTVITDINRLETFQCSMTIEQSSKSFGLQIIDVILWLMKRFEENPGSMKGQCEELAKLVIQHGVISRFTTDSLLEEVVKEYLQIMELPLTPEQEAKARPIVERFEAARLARMNEPPDLSEPVA